MIEGRLSRRGSSRHSVLGNHSSLIVVPTRAPWLTTIAERPRDVLSTPSVALSSADSAQDHYRAGANLFRCGRGAGGGAPTVRELLAETDSAWSQARRESGHDGPDQRDCPSP